MKLFIISLIIQALASTDIIQCSDKRPFYLKLIPVNYATLLPGDSAHIVGRCFRSIDIKLIENDDSFEISYFAKDKNSWLCSDLIILTTGKTPKFTLPFITGSYNVTFDKKAMSQYEINYTRKRGIRVLMSCEDLADWPKSLFMSLKLYIGGMGLNPYVPIFGSKIPEYQFSANLDWIKGATGYEYQRVDDYFLTLDKKQIKSGTTIMIYRFDGIDNMIHIGSGSRAGHTAIAMWKDDELYIVESQNAAYWPVLGVQKTPWDEWMKLAHNADYNVVLLPMKEEFAAKFDVEKAWAWFDHVVGLDYGFHNFLFVWLDAPTKNLPYFIDFDSLTILIDIYALIRPQDIKLIFLEALNRRLSAQATSISDIWEELFIRDMTFEEAMAIVEEEGWQYSNGLNYVCSTLVTSLLRRGGMFGDMNINSTEFTPKDLYQLEFFDNSGKNLPKECTGENAKFGYCQVMGKVRMDLGEVGFVAPYEHMNEHCPTIAPEYERAKGC